MNWFWREVDWMNVLMAVPTLMAVVATGVVLWALLVRDPRDERAQCHRWYSAAATARDSLWIETLRKECTP